MVAPGWKIGRIEGFEMSEFLINLLFIEETESHYAVQSSAIVYISPRILKQTFFYDSLLYLFLFLDHLLATVSLKLFKGLKI